MAVEAEGRRLSLEQGLAGRGMAVMTGQALPFAGGFMDGQYAFSLLPLIMTTQADLGRFIS